MKTSSNEIGAFGCGIAVAGQAGSCAPPPDSRVATTSIRGTHHPAATGPEKDIQAVEIFARHRAAFMNKPSIDDLRAMTEDPNTPQDLRDALRHGLSVVGQARPQKRRLQESSSCASSVIDGDRIPQRPFHGCLA
jgi:hypothetical protein